MTPTLLLTFTSTPIASLCSYSLVHVACDGFSSVKRRPTVL